jgi:hypothetical protein
VLSLATWPLAYVLFVEEAHEAWKYSAHASETMIVAAHCQAGCCRYSICCCCLQDLVVMEFENFALDVRILCHYFQG